MKVEAIKCDVCGRVKGESNKWLVLREHNGDGPSVHIGRRRDFEDDGQLEDICSDTCLHKRLGEVLVLIREEPVNTHEEAINILASISDRAV